MSTVCGRPQGGEGDPAHVDRGVKNVIFCGRHKWMAPYNRGLSVIKRFGQTMRSDDVMEQH